MFNLPSWSKVMSTREEQAIKQESFHDPKLLELSSKNPVLIVRYLLLTRRLSRWRARIVDKKGFLHYLTSITETLENGAFHQKQIDRILAIEVVEDCLKELEIYIENTIQELDKIENDFEK